MAVDHIDQFAVTVPPGTLAAAPMTLRTPLNQVQLDWIEIRMPPGPRGQVGFFVASSGAQVVPFRVGVTPNWLFLDGESVHYEMIDQPTSGDWSVVAFNIGNYPHTFYVRYGSTLIAAPPAGRVNLIPAGALSG